MIQFFETARNQYTVVTTHMAPPCEGSGMRDVADALPGERLPFPVGKGGVIYEPDILHAMRRSTA